MHKTEHALRRMKSGYKSALILGLGESGAAAARLLSAGGARITVLDENRSDEILARAAELDAFGAAVSAGVKRIPAGSYEVCVVSPGLPPGSPLLREAECLGISIIPEFELGWSEAGCPALAITGSNGKSTCVKLCQEALTAAGVKAFAAGNYGPSVSRVVLEHPDAEWLVIEVSSFQLERARAFRSRASVVLNVFPNHLDRHGDFKTYIALKARLLAMVENGGRAIANETDLDQLGRLAGSGLRLVSFGLTGKADFRFHGHAVTARPGNYRADLAGTHFDNEILGTAAAAAAAAMEACGVPAQCLERAARAFKPLPHRMQAIGSIKGILFVDDSKATNLASMLAALRMVKGRARLIAGGLPKHESYAPARELLAAKAAGVYLIGKAADEMASAWRGAVECHMCGTLAQAVENAWGHAAAGETVLLSPACASFDQFRSFEERGAAFRSQYEKIAAHNPEAQTQPAAGTSNKEG